MRRLSALVGWLALAGCSSPAAGTAPATVAVAGAVESEAAETPAGDGIGGGGTPTGEAAAAGEGGGAKSGEAAAAGEGVGAKAGETAAPAEGVGAKAAEGAAAGANAASKPRKGSKPFEASLTDDPWLTELLARDTTIARLMEDPARYRLQVLVTVISPAGVTSQHGYRTDAEYIYPASAIKTFASVAALRKLEALRRDGHAVGLDTPVAICAGEGKRRRCKTEDETNVEGGVITLGHEIRKMQLVSNNFAFNRLYDFVGHREINEDLWALGFKSLRMHHRMYGGTDPLVQRTTPRMELRPPKGKRVVIPARVSDLELPPTPATELQIGVAYIDDATGGRVDEPMDFAGKNYISMRELHLLALALARPDLPGVPDLGLAPADREFLLQAMTEDPLQSKNPIYTEEHDSGLRYHTMIKGMLRVMELPRIRYVGKAGRAYGFHLDNAYVEDQQSGRAMAVTVVGYANANGVLNDNVYEYDTVTRPLFLGLGELLGRAVLLGEGLPPTVR